MAEQIRRLWGQDYCQVIQCDACGFCFSNPYVSGNDEFYRLAYDRKGYPKWKWEYQVTYDKLNPLSGKNIRLLEIGAGDGAFVRRIVGSVVPHQNILCTEYSDFGRTQIERLGVRCVAKDVRELTESETGGCFDVICMFQVLEHMDDLDNLFRKLNTLLKDGGSLFVAVPNQARIKFNEHNGALLDMPPNHIGRWGVGCFDLIGSRNGFRVHDNQLESTNFIQSVKQYSVYRFLRQAQTSGSVANKIQSLNNEVIMRCLQFVAVAALTVMSIPLFMKKEFGAGDSLWVQLVKT